MDTHSSALGSHFVQEQAVAIELNGLTFAVMMLSPQDLEHFALGFLYSEGIVEQASDIRDIEQEPISSVDQNAQQHPTLQLGITLKISLSNRSFHRFKERIRLVKGTSGCGICGSAALAHTFDQAPSNREKQKPTKPFDIKMLNNIRSRVKQCQTISAKSGAMHAAFLIAPKGDIKVVSEDIGRHSALDKLIGKILANNINHKHHAIIVTSRCGAELVQKVIRLGIDTLVSFASPSDLAMQLATNEGITLIHVPKKDSPLIYTSASSEHAKLHTPTSQQVASND